MILYTFKKMGYGMALSGGIYNPVYLCYFHDQITLKIFNLPVCFIRSYSFTEVSIRIYVQIKIKSLF